MVPIGPPAGFERPPHSLMGAFARALGGPFVPNRRTRTIGSMAGPERDLEDELYVFEGVLAARVLAIDDGRRLEVGLLVRPTTDVAALHGPVLRVIQERTGRRPDDVVLRIVPLGMEASSAAHDPPDTPLIDLRNQERERGEPPPGGGRRIQLESVLGVTSGTKFTAEVCLRHPQDELATGTAHGSAFSTSVARVVAEATIQALLQLSPPTLEIHLDNADLFEFGRLEVAIVSTALIQDTTGETVTGAAVVRSGGRMDALARAVLDGTNRRIVAAPLGCRRAFEHERTESR